MPLLRSCQCIGTALILKLQMSKPKNDFQSKEGGTSEKSNGFDTPGDLPTRVHAVSNKVTGPLHRRMDTSFLQYASYVIRDRAIANLADGLKPVQRRILWALHEKDDGKFIKVANVVGHAMQYHPHGDASIGDALVVLANKRYLIEGQGNYGNIF